ncbi:MAG: EpsI family protein [Pirellulales bacterium]|nr:EpsI family protein [Pirellulales bacterium]
MKSALYVIGLTLVVAVTAGSALGTGYLTNRWNRSDGMAAAADAVEALPTSIGPWEAQHSSELTEEVVRTLQCAGYVSRTYIHQQTGQRVTVAVLVGPAGPISVHTPEVCYSSRDYQIVEKAQRQSFPSSEAAPAELWSVTLQAPGGDDSMLRVYYGWSAGKGWQAPDNPRFTYRGGVLYKVQVASPHAAGATSSDNCREFLELFLPILSKTIGAAANAA